MADSDWKVVKEEPAGDQWKVVKEEPQAGKLAMAAGAIGNPLIGTSGLSRMGELASEGAQSVVQGIKGMADKNPYNYWYREPLANVVGGLGQIVSSPAGLVSPYLEKIGIPKEASEFALPFMIPGAKAGAAKVGEMFAKGGEAAKGEETIAQFAARMRAPKGSGNIISDVQERASLQPPSKREAFLRDEMQAILDDPAKRKLFTPDQIDRIKKIAHGSVGKDAMNALGELAGHLLGGATGRTIGRITGAPISRMMTERQVRQLADTTKDQGSVGLGTVAPLKRDVIARGRSGRPTETERLNVGKEGEVLEAGARRVAATGPDDRMMRATMKAAMPRLPQAETDQILDAAIGAIKEFGSPKAAAANMKMDNPVWDRAFQAALRGADSEDMASHFAQHQGSVGLGTVAPLDKIPFDLRVKSEAMKRGLRTHGRLGGPENYSDIQATKRTMARWAREKRNEK